jgi:hypothetical protein
MLSALCPRLIPFHFKNNTDGQAEEVICISNFVIPFICEAAYNSPPGYRRPPDALLRCTHISVLGAKCVLIPLNPPSKGGL